MNRSLFLACLLLPGVPFLFSATSENAAHLTRVSPQGELDELVAAELSAAPARAIDELWSRALDLVEAGHLAEPGALDGALDRALLRSCSPQATVLLASARLHGERPDVGLLATPLMKLFDQQVPELVRAAATLLADRKFRNLEAGKREKLVERALAEMKNLEFDPDTRLAFARLAYMIGPAVRDARSKAEAEMNDFLASADPELSAKGALALAGVGVLPEGNLKRKLERLASAPNASGALAKSYLEQEEIRSVYEDKLNRVKSQSEAKLLPPELEEFQSVLHMIKALHLDGDKVSQEDLVEAAMNGMLQFMDPYSNYLSSDELTRFMQDLEADYGGIGAYVENDVETNLFTITRPIYSGPAYRAGLQTDDKVVRIDDWPTIGHDREEIIKRLKGKPGTRVQLYVWRRGMDPLLVERPTEAMKVEIVREKIEIPAVAWQLLPGGIGMIELSTFSRPAMEQIERAIPEMQKNGMRGLVLDLRRNSGGLLTEAREVAELFLPPGSLVVTTEGQARGGVAPPPSEELRTERSPIVPPEMPIVVLTSQYTASAAEIVSGALQDHGRASLVGIRTFGKGSVQNLLRIPDAPEDDYVDENDNMRWDPWEAITVDHDRDGAVDYAPRVKLTIARYLLPSGRSIHHQLDRDGTLKTMGGVEPDQEVRLPVIERWRYEEESRIDKTHALRDYVDREWPKNRSLFDQLAVSDNRDESLYPGFEELYASLATTLSRDDVRRSLRDEVRRRVQDDRGAEFPIGDFEEDLQVQAAIRSILEKLGEAPDAVAAFQVLFDLAQKEGGLAPGLTALRQASPQELRRARALIQEARDASGSLSPEDLAELEAILARSGYGTEARADSEDEKR